MLLVAVILELTMSGLLHRQRQRKRIAEDEPKEKEAETNVSFQDKRNEWIFGIMFCSKNIFFGPGSGSCWAVQL